MAGMQFTIWSEADLIKAINKYGFLPFFRNSIEGFSIEEHIAPEHWYYSNSGQWDAWEWKGPVIQKTGCAYGKFFEHKAVYISKVWFPDFANYRRDGYDFDARSVMPKKSVRQMFRKYPDVVTIPQVCEMLGVSRNYAYLLVKQGKLTRLDLGRIVRVTKSSVIELKEKSLQKSENSPV